MRSRRPSGAVSVRALGGAWPSAGSGRLRSCCVGVLLGHMHCGRDQFVQHTEVRAGLSVVTSAGAGPCVSARETSDQRASQRSSRSRHAASSRLKANLGTVSDRWQPAPDVRPSPDSRCERSRAGRVWSAVAASNVSMLGARRAPLPAVDRCSGRRRTRSGPNADAQYRLPSPRPASAVELAAVGGQPGVDHPWLT
jgi:hypothetical protein